MQAFDGCGLAGDETHFRPAVQARQVVAPDPAGGRPVMNQPALAVQPKHDVGVKQVAGVWKGGVAARTPPAKEGAKSLQPIIGCVCKQVVVERLEGLMFAVRRDRITGIPVELHAKHIG